MLEIRSLRQQLTNILNNLDPSLQLELDSRMNPPTKSQVKLQFCQIKRLQALLLRQIITAGFIDQVAMRKMESNSFCYYQACRCGISVVIWHNEQHWGASADTSYLLYGWKSPAVLRLQVGYCSSLSILQGAVSKCKEYLYEGGNLNWPLLVGSCWISVVHLLQALWNSSAYVSRGNNCFDIFQIWSNKGPNQMLRSCDIWPTFVVSSHPRNRISTWVEQIQILCKISVGRANFLWDEEIYGMPVIRKYWLTKSLWNSKPSTISKAHTQQKVVAIVQPLYANNIDTKKKLQDKW